MIPSLAPKKGWTEGGWTVASLHPSLATPESVTDEIEHITHLSPYPPTEAGAYLCLTKMWPRQER